MDTKEKVEEALERLGEEAKSIRYVGSLFGKHKYPVEWGILRIVNFDVARGIGFLDQRLVTFPSAAFTWKERSDFANRVLSRARRNLEKHIGVN
jgi:hypothetical protein